MHRWLLRLTNPFLFSPDDEGGAGAPSGDGGSAAASDGGASPAAPDSGAAPAAPSADPGAPSTPPAGGAAPSSDGAPPSDPFDFMDHFEGDDLVSVEPPAAPAQAEPTPAQPPAAPAQPAPQAQAPGSQAPQGAGAEAPGASPIPTDPGELVDSIRQNAPALLEQMANSYKLSQEEAEALENDVVGTLPKLFARVHLNASVAALHNMKQLIPTMIRQAITADRTKRDNLESFYKAWPQLDRANPAHMEAVAQLGGAYRRANPTASREAAIKAIGTLALHHLGLPLQSAPGAPNGRTVSQRPFVPAQGGGAPAPAAPAEYDPFAGMGMEFED